MLSEVPHGERAAEEDRRERGLSVELGDEFMRNGQLEQALYVYKALRDRNKLILLGDQFVAQNRQLYLAADAFEAAEAFDKLSQVGDWYRDGDWFEMARDIYIRARDWQRLSDLLKAEQEKG